jgi:hypothetical protein
MKIAHRTPATVAAMVALGLPAASPVLVAAASGGGAAPAPISDSSRATPRSVSAAGGGISVTTRPVGLLSQRLTFSGSASRRDARDIVEIQRQDPSGRWLDTAHGAIARDGSFAAAWHVNHIGRFALRAVLRHPGRSARVASASPPLRVTIYKPAIATIFGPGFFGKRTACGQTLTRATLGVAHRWLACGTKVSLYYHGRSITVPVIDRGPYANGADWDLTSATAAALHVDGTIQVGALALRAGR